MDRRRFILSGLEVIALAILRPFQVIAGSGLPMVTLPGPLYLTCDAAEWVVVEYWPLGPLRSTDLIEEPGADG